MPRLRRSGKNLLHHLATSCQTPPGLFRHCFCSRRSQRITQSFLCRPIIDNEEHRRLTHNINYSSGFASVLAATVFVLMVSGFVLFFPACIVMFRRIERRLDAIILERDHRPDHINVLLPFEFLLSDRDGSRRSQIQMLAGQARNLLGEMKTAAANQRSRFIICLVLALLALVFRTAFFLAFAIMSIHNTSDPGCTDRCGNCQPIARLIFEWYRSNIGILPLVYALSSTIPLTFSLWLMTTPADRELLLHPSRFRVQAVAAQLLPPIENGTAVIMETGRARMGIDLQ